MGVGSMTARIGAILSPFIVMVVSCTALVLNPGEQLCGIF